MDSKTYTPTEIVAIKNNLSLDIDLGLYLNFVDGGVILSNKIYLDTLKKLDYLLNPKKIVTSKLQMYIVVNKIPKISKNEIIITL